MKTPITPQFPPRHSRFRPATTVVLRCALLALCATSLTMAGVDALAAPAADERAPEIAAATEGATSLHAWHAAARDAIARQRPNQQAALRILAVLSLAQHRAAEAFAASTPLSDAAWQALFDGVSAPILSALMPAEADTFKRLAEALAASRRGATVAPDVQHAEAVAAAVALDAVAAAAADGFDQPWSGAVPAGSATWRSLLQPARAPHLPALGRMKPMFIAAGDAIRPAPPPAPGSSAFAQALAEVKSAVAEASPARQARARRWEMITGSLVAGFWDETASRLIAQHGLPGREASRVLAATLGATLDANIACHDAKYAYWTPRPSQADPSIRPVIGLPNHPSYPSNHACDSGAAAEVLGALFPARREDLRAMAREAGESRIDGGIHYRFDIDAGFTIGDAAAQAALRALPARTTRVTQR